MKIMSATHTRPLFSRDLKHLVDLKYSVAPRRKSHPWATWLVCVSAVAAGIWGISALRITDMPTDPGAQTAQQSVAPEVRQIAPHSAELDKTAGETGNESIQTEISKVDRAQPTNKADTAKSITRPAEEKTAAVDAGNTPHSKNASVTWQDYTVQSGDSLARIFHNNQLDVGDAIRIAKHKEAGEIEKLMPGQKLRIGYDEENKLRALSIDLRANRKLLIELDRDGSIHVDEHQMEFDKREVAVSAMIESSLFKAGAKAGLDDKFILQLVDIFAWDIDFAKDLKKGDRFTLLYEQLIDGHKNKGTGDILAAEFITQGQKIYAFRHTDLQGNAEYFDAEGNSLRGTFLRTPMKISRITSGFSRKRMHPILKQWRSHKGVDYAAPRGTPVLSTADGRVSFLGRKGGYGKTVVLRHGSTYSTLYAHLSSYKSKLRPGSAVEQGQVIGFVGKTGMATAPHLHYEFRVHGKHRDPLSYEFPRAESISDKEREDFLAKAQLWMEAMAQYNSVQLAQNESAQ